MSFGIVPVIILQNILPIVQKSSKMCAKTVKLLGEGQSRPELYLCCSGQPWCRGTTAS